MFNSNCMSPADMAAVMGTNNRGNNDGFGYGADWIIWLIVIAAIFGNGWGFGGFGGGYGNGGFNSPVGQGSLTRADVDAALSTQGIESGINGIGTQLCNGFAGVNSAIANLGYQLQQCLNRFAKAITNLFTKNVNTVGTYA